VRLSTRHVLFQLPGAHADHAGPECTRISPFPPGSRNPRGVVGDLWQVFAQVKSVCLHFIYFCQRKSIMEKTWPLRHGALTLLSRCVCVCLSFSLTHFTESEAPWAAKIAPPFNSNKRRHHRRRRRRLKQKVGVALKCVSFEVKSLTWWLAGWMEGIDAYRRASELSERP
jgi:hypothetical protein